VEQGKKTIHGGRRPGSGRRALFADRVGITVQRERSDHEALAKAARDRGASIGAVIREAIHAFLARGRKR
jgi:hypothetical protein